MKYQQSIQEFIQTSLVSDSENSISLDDNLILSETLDSLTIMRLVDFLELEYATEIPAHEVTLENFQSINAISAFLQIHLSGAGA
jgi:acyl carrier protein